MSAHSCMDSLFFEYDKTRQPWKIGRRAELMAAPLAESAAPKKTLDDMVGQRHLLAPGKVLRKIIESGEIPNLVFYGPSGVGKTTLATMIARQTNRKCV